MDGFHQSFLIRDPFLFSPSLPLLREKHIPFSSLSLALPSFVRLRMFHCKQYPIISSLSKFLSVGQELIH